MIIPPIAEHVQAPSVDTIFRREPAPHPLDILTAPELASGVRAGLEIATQYRVIAQALLAQLHTALAERDTARGEARRLRREAGA